MKKNQTGVYLCFRCGLQVTQPVAQPLSCQAELTILLLDAGHALEHHFIILSRQNGLQSACLCMYVCEYRHCKCACIMSWENPKWPTYMLVLLCWSGVAIPLLSKTCWTLSWKHLSCIIYCIIYTFLNNNFMNNYTMSILSSLNDNVWWYSMLQITYNSCEKTKIDNELILLSIASVAWCVIDLHCCPKAIKNTSISHTVAPAAVSSLWWTWVVLFVLIQPYIL